MAYFLSKILPLAVLPLGLSLILVILGLIAHRRWPVCTALLLLWVFFPGTSEPGPLALARGTLAASRSDGRT